MDDTHHQTGSNLSSQEQAMKLNSTQVEQTLSQFHAEVLPDNHPAVRKLNDLFGDHTFFLDGSGLNVLEPTEMPEKEVQAGEIVSRASASKGLARRCRAWSDQWHSVAECSGVPSELAGT